MMSSLQVRSTETMRGRRIATGVNSEDALVGLLMKYGVLYSVKDMDASIQTWVFVEDDPVIRDTKIKEKLQLLKSIANLRLENRAVGSKMGSTGGVKVVRLRSLIQMGIRIMMVMTF